MIQIQTREVGGDIVIKTPYSDYMRGIFSCYGGRFDRPSYAWVLPRCDNTSDMIKELFGISNEVVAARLGPDDVKVVEHEWLIGGYLLASRRYYNSDVRVPGGVRILRGWFDKEGGSVDAPRVTFGEEPEILLHCCRDFAEENQLKTLQGRDGSPVW